ncbi:MAG: rod shape-determining protein MreD [Lachnospiraceae bacterium]|nr:rod shape-determining protein MreD [Lachnospiraceae bacterium]
MIKKSVVACLIIILCYVFQTTIFWHLRLANVVPNLMLIYVVSTGYLNGRREAVLVAMGCGLLSDMIYGSVIGLHSLIYIIIGFIAGYGHNIYLKNNFSLPLLLIGICDIVYGFLYYVFEFLFRGKLDIMFYFGKVILPETIYTMLVAIILFKLFSVINRFTHPGSNKEEY